MVPVKSCRIPKPVRLAKKTMKAYVATCLLMLSVGCIHANSHLSSQDRILEQLKTQLNACHVDVRGMRVDLSVEWVTHARAQQCQRPLDINLPEHKLGAFLFPVQNLTPLDGPSLGDVADEFGKQVDAYLRANGIPEKRIYTGRDIGNYMNSNAVQGGPETGSDL